MICPVGPDLWAPTTAGGRTAPTPKCATPAGENPPPPQKPPPPAGGKPPPPPAGGHPHTPPHVVVPHRRPVQNDHGQGHQPRPRHARHARLATQLLRTRHSSCGGPQPHP